MCAQSRISHSCWYLHSLLYLCGHDDTLISTYTHHPTRAGTLPMFIWPPPPSADVSSHLTTSSKCTLTSALILQREYHTVGSPFETFTTWISCYRSSCAVWCLLCGDVTALHPFLLFVGRASCWPDALLWVQGVQLSGGMISSGDTARQPSAGLHGSPLPSSSCVIPRTGLSLVHGTPVLRVGVCMWVSARLPNGVPED